MTETTEQAIHRYFNLARQADTDTYFAQFTDDAVVEDEGVQHHGIAAIRTWRTTVPLVTYTIHTITRNDTGHHAHVDIAGDFPGSPVRLTFHFQLTPDNHINHLTIRP